jgi:hypothetical protein
VGETCHDDTWISSRTFSLHRPVNEEHVGGKWQQVLVFRCTNTLWSYATLLYVLVKLYLMLSVQGLVSA